MDADNQHATLKLAWFSGVLDGEGSFMIIRNFRNGKPRYGYRISLANTNQLIINESKEILDFLDIKYCNYIQDRRDNGLKRKMTYLIHITNRNGIIKLLKFVIPYLIGKRKQAELLDDFLKDWKNADKEYAYNLFKKLNERTPRRLREPSETIRQTKF